jgi:hypothetical protein
MSYRSLRTSNCETRAHLSPTCLSAEVGLLDPPPMRTGTAKKGQRPSKGTIDVGGAAWRQYASAGFITCSARQNARRRPIDARM